MTTSVGVVSRGRVGLFLYCLHGNRDLESLETLMGRRVGIEGRGGEF